MRKRAASLLLHLAGLWFHNSTFFRHEWFSNHLPRNPRQQNSFQCNEEKLWSVCFHSWSVEINFQVCEDAVVLTLHSWKIYPTPGIPRVIKIHQKSRPISTDRFWKQTEQSISSLRWNMFCSLGFLGRWFTSKKCTVVKLQSGKVKKWEAARFLTGTTMAPTCSKVLGRSWSWASKWCSQPKIQRHRVSNIQWWASSSLD